MSRATDLNFRPPKEITNSMYYSKVTNYFNHYNLNIYLCIIIKLVQLQRTTIGME